MDDKTKQDCIEAFKELGEQLCKTEKMLPVVIQVVENVLETDDFMDEYSTVREITDKDIGAIGYISACLIVRKMVHIITKMIEDDVLVPDGTKATEIADKIKQEEQKDEDEEEELDDEDEDDDDDDGFNITNFLKHG